jgi:hypothetical protein
MKLGLICLAPGAHRDRGYICPYGVASHYPPFRHTQDALSGVEELMHCMLYSSDKLIFNSDSLELALVAIRKV